ncbi:Hypothetical protein IALB_0993 [Ignavibacterium album JCM 16511]|uniref:Glucosyl transferase n=1 Tax=Ignavibacterium album (strain DSM 19864 / JCM 16511 / NBRC 101810 / Mat9-16) TaxID=945713 RepID=I0AI97_IGNAJ|nr:hypothetical protein [Ignavibacterium album]AFH48704.1 Hypothetical protein IALB_0993 [Ignavibacterium album JCM 16511]
MKPISLMPLLILFIQILLITTGCKQTTEPKLEPELKLELEDVSCTEAWINLRATNLQLPANVTLYKNSVAQNNILCYGDTLLYVDSLLPNQTYKFNSIIQSSNQQIITSSNELTVTTMDTTSHDFTWQTWTFGQHSSSTLYDVAIIDENNIWAVGEIYMLDSLGRPDPNAYNAVHWDGTKWELKRIYFYTFCGQQSMGSYPAKSIFAFGSNDIWIGMDGSQIVRFDGQSQSQPICTPVSINKLWGSSSSDLYAVGNNGNIAHWDGVKWRKIESGTYLNIYDIYSDNGEIICIASDKSLSSGKKILSIRYGITSEIDNTGLSSNLSSIWFKSQKKYYIVGAGIYFSNNLNKTNWKRTDYQSTRYSEKIRGTNFNDIFIVGSYNQVLHFNGFSWYEYTEYEFGENLSVDIKNNMVVMVGWENDSARIIMGKRQN